MKTDIFMMILGEAVASASELSKLRKFEQSLLCFAASEVTLQHEGFVSASQKMAFTKVDWGICEEAKTQVLQQPQLTVILHKPATGQINVLSFRQALSKRGEQRKPLIERLAEMEQMLGNCIQMNQAQRLLCAAITIKKLNAKEQRWVKKLEQTMIQHFRQAPLKVEELADMACLSKRQLNRRVKAVLGVSPAQWIREVQLQLALQELERGRPESVIQVALNNGFEHASTFSTLFKRRFGCSPGQYLRQ